MPEITRRRLLKLSAALPFGAMLIACSGGKSVVDDAIEEVKPPEPTATPEPPFVVQAGEYEIMMLRDTPYETPLHIYGSGLPGRVVMALGGVHGNEPGGWQAAEELRDTLRPARGAFIVMPRANKQAVALFERTTDELGDLNRMYPGDANGKPMAQMANAIVGVLREYHVDTLVDMHESWAFYKDRPQNGTAFLGQTVATYPTDDAAAFAKGVVEAVNGRVRSSQEEFFYRDRVPSVGVPGVPTVSPGNSSSVPSFGGSASSLGLPRYIDKLTVMLVEMGQQQELSRRVALHVDVFAEVARRTAIIDA